MTSFACKNASSRQTIASWTCKAVKQRLKPGIWEGLELSLFESVYSCKDLLTHTILFSQRSTIFKAREFVAQKSTRRRNVWGSTGRSLPCCFRRLAEANFTKISTKQGAFFAADSTTPTNKDR